MKSGRLFGITSVQIYIYFHKSQRDNNLIKGSVWMIKHFSSPGLSIDDQHSQVFFLWYVKLHAA